MRQPLQTLLPRFCRASHLSPVARPRLQLCSFHRTSQLSAKYQIPRSTASPVTYTMATTKTGQPLDRGILDTLLRRRLFYTPAFEIYNGVSGLYDYGPPGCALQANIVDLWRKHFVLEEDMLEVDCTMLTPGEVLKTSGHVDKFADWMCKDMKSGDFWRADHLVEQVLEARLKGDKEARGEKVEDTSATDDKKKKKKVKDIKAVKLDEAVKKEYEEVLAMVGLMHLDNCHRSLLMENRLTTMMAQSLVP